VRASEAERRRCARRRRANALCSPRGRRPLPRALSLPGCGRSQRTDEDGGASDDAGDEEGGHGDRIG
jgi:hypothetical protein